MKKHSRLTHWDVLFVLFAGFFFMGCLVTTHRTARTLHKGQVSTSAAYSGLPPGGHIINTDLRVGAARGVDIGLNHTLDASNSSGNDYGTIWGDAKIQLTNRDNRVKGITLSTGLMKGYMYNSEVHATTFPVGISWQASETFTPFLNYRLNLYSDEFIPLDSPFAFGAFVVGGEFALVNPNEKKWTPRLSVGLGSFGGSFLLNFGMSFDSPIK